MANLVSATSSSASATRPAAPAPRSASPFDKILYDAITFDDVLLLPRRSDFTPSDADVRTRLTRNIEINIPLLSAPMDTVTESALAIALAQEGGLGVIHKNLPAAAQAREVEKVKRSENGVIADPVTLPPSATIGEARRIMREYNVSGIPIVDSSVVRGPSSVVPEQARPTGAGSTDNGQPTTDGPQRIENLGEPPRLLGILTRRDLKYQDDDARRVEEVMTRSNLITAAPTRRRPRSSLQAVGNWWSLSRSRIVIRPARRPC